MKKIIINQKDSKEIELLDDDQKDLTTYTKEISKIMELTKICILETTFGNIIIKPSEIRSINILEVDNKNQKNINQKIENSNVKSVVANQNDVIKD
jgi:ribonuclease HII